MPDIRHQSLPSRREWLQSALAAGAASAGGSCRRQQRPNILWIIAEDFSPDLGCYGNKLVHTPNLDRLAAQGVRFTRAFVTGPVCSASRSAIATGMYQTTIGAHHHRSHRDDNFRLPPPVEVFTHYLREAGYHTSNLEKVPGIGGTGKTDFNFAAESVFDGKDWSERRPGQPFYAQINFSETHRAFKRFGERPVDPNRVELPPYYPDHPAVRLDWALYLDDAQHLDVNAGRVLARLEQEGLAEDTIVFFFGDHGRPMPRGKQFLYDEGIRIPLIVRIPEQYRPEGYVAGTVNDDLVSSIDITATTLRLAGIEPPPHMEGRPFFGPGAKKRDWIIAARDRCDETVDRIRCVRDRRFKYIRNFYPERPYAQQNVYKDTQYPTLAAMRQLHEEGRLSGAPALFLAPTRPAEELYDLETDPHEIRNLAGSAEHQAKLDEMRRILEEWIRRTGDQGARPEAGPTAWDKDRTEVDGWCTQTNCRLGKSGGALRLECSGKGAQMLRSYVTEGGEMLLEFRARSQDAALTAAGWGLIERMRDPAFRVPVDFRSGGEWRDYRIEFTAAGYLGQLRFECADTPGTIEFAWIRLGRKRGGGLERIKEWRFA